MTLTLSLVSLQDEAAFLKACPNLKIKSSADSVAWKNFFLKKFNLATETIPFATLGAMALNWRDDVIWLRADPVYFQSDLSQVYLQTVQLTDAQKLAMQQSLLPYLEEEKLNLLFAENEYYLQLPLDPEIVTTPLVNVIGKNIFNYLPRGKNSAHWRRWLTEMQMIISHAAIGSTNGLWLWGEGQLPKTATSNFNYVYTDANWLKGLAKIANLKIITEIKIDKSSYGHYLIMINDKNAEQQLLTSLLPTISKYCDKIEIILLNASYVLEGKSWWRKFL